MQEQTNFVLSDQHQSLQQVSEKLAATTASLEEVAFQLLPIPVSHVHCVVTDSRQSNSNGSEDIEHGQRAES